MTYHGIDFNREEIAQFCQRHGIKRLSLFGSILRDDFGPDRDIDILVEFEPGQTPSLFTLGGILMELRERLGREVDLKTPGFLSPRIRRQVAAEAQVQYAA